MFRISLCTVKIIGEWSEPEPHQNDAFPKHCMKAYSYLKILDLRLQQLPVTLKKLQIAYF
jgi:hypothetical protein